MNCIPRRDGRYSGLDHFGIEVEDLDDTIARIAKFDSTLSAVKRPPIRPFALTARMIPTPTSSICLRRIWACRKTSMRRMIGPPRSISHIAAAHAPRDALRTVLCGGVRIDALNRPKDDNFYLSRRRVTLMIIRGGLPTITRRTPRARPGPYRVQGRKRGRGETRHGILIGRTHICMGARWDMVLKAKRG